MNCLLHSCVFGAFTQARDPTCDTKERNSESEKSEKPSMSFEMRDFFLSTGVFQVFAWLLYLSKHTRAHTHVQSVQRCTVGVDVCRCHRLHESRHRVPNQARSSWHVTPCSRIRSRWVRAGSQTPVHTGRALKSINPHTVDPSDWAKSTWSLLDLS